MNHSIEIAPAAATPIGLQLPDDLSMDEWARMGRQLCRSNQMMQWAIGDWALFGCQKYGQLKEFAEANGINYGTLRNLASVAEKVELSRRRDNLEWSKHVEVAGLEPEEQVKWLDKAEKESLLVADLRRQIRQSQGENNALESDGPIMRFGSKYCDDLIRWLKNKPSDFWEDGRKADWKERLKPIVEFYQTL